MQARGPSHDTPSCWDGIGDSQLQDDVSETLNDSKKLFGAVAIGNGVRFYQFNGRAGDKPSLIQLHQGTFDMDTADGIVQVEHMMNYIKEIA